MEILVECQVEKGKYQTICVHTFLGYSSNNDQLSSHGFSIPVSQEPAAPVVLAAKCPRIILDLNEFSRHVPSSKLNCYPKT